MMVEPDLTTPRRSDPTAVNLLRLALGHLRDSGQNTAPRQKLTGQLEGYLTARDEATARGWQRVDARNEGRRPAAVVSLGEPVNVVARAYSVGSRAVGDAGYAEFFDVQVEVVTVDTLPEGRGLIVRSCHGSISDRDTVPLADQAEAIAWRVLGDVAEAAADPEGWWVMASGASDTPRDTMRQVLDVVDFADSVAHVIEFYADAIARRTA